VSSERARDGDGASDMDDGDDDDATTTTTTTMPACAERKGVSATSRRGKRVKQTIRADTGEPAMPERLHAASCCQAQRDCDALTCDVLTRRPSEH